MDAHTHTHTGWLKITRPADSHTKWKLWGLILILSEFRYFFFEKYLKKILTVILWFQPAVGRPRLLLGAHVVLLQQQGPGGGLRPPATPQLQLVLSECSSSHPHLSQLHHTASSPATIRKTKCVKKKKKLAIEVGRSTAPDNVDSPVSRSPG